MLLSNVTAYGTFACAGVTLRTLQVTVGVATSDDVDRVYANWVDVGFPEFVFKVYGLGCGASLNLDSSCADGPLTAAPPCLPPPPPPRPPPLPPPP
eukprot:343026-Chlamydomonas_euryale.AAC.1